MPCFLEFYREAVENKETEAIDRIFKSEEFTKGLEERGITWDQFWVDLPWDQKDKILHDIFGEAPPKRGPNAPKDPKKKAEDLFHEQSGHKHDDGTDYESDVEMVTTERQVTQGGYGRIAFKK
jgi:hypothetical protein